MISPYFNNFLSGLHNFSRSFWGLRVTNFLPVCEHRTEEAHVHNLFTIFLLLFLSFGVIIDLSNERKIKK